MVTLPSRAEAEPRIARLTVDQVQSMVEAGIIAEGAPIELVDGVLVYKDRSDHGEDPMTIGKKHNLGVKLLARIDPDLIAHGCQIQTQGPVRVPPHDEPEPDGAIVRGQPRDYTDRIPTASDVLSVIEVADASLAYDRSTKLALYARAAIGQYVIVNLRHGCLEVHERPAAGEERFESVAVLRPGETVGLRVGAGERLEIEVERLLP